MRSTTRGRSGINRALGQLLVRPEQLQAVTPDPKVPVPLYPLEGDGVEPALTRFLEATTDAVRLVHASVVSRAILSQYDLAELEDLRRELQFGELSRTIPYQQQTDHSAHTLYLYLLGKFLYFNSPRIEKAVEAFLAEEKANRRTQRFLFRWVYVSLLHDVGYVFQGAPERERRAVDRLFRPARVCGFLDAGSRDDARLALAGLRLPRFEGLGNSEDVLDELRRIPWGAAVQLDNDGFGVFDMLVGPGIHPTPAELERFAYSVAAAGYDGISGGVVDHAVASGLLLLSYATFWYWIAFKLKHKGELNPYKNAGEFLRNDIVPACYATAAHNIIGTFAKKAPTKLRLEDEPLLYLGVLCDELQKWDRFPVGERYLGDLESFSKACTDSEGITLSVTGERVVMKVAEEELAAKIIAALKDRLEQPEAIIDVRGPSSRPLA